MTLADTGNGTLTGGRVKKIEKYIDQDTFIMTYGDGLSNVNLKELIRFHRDKGKIATVTGVRPIARFGELLVDGDLVKTFSEKPQIENGWISGGFFVFERKIFDYLDEECMLERKPLEKLAQENQLAVYKHSDYWRCMDTYRDLEALNQEWASGRPGWLT